MSGINLINLNLGGNWTAFGVHTYDRANGGTLVAPAGDAFPTTPVAGEFFWRTDEAKLYRRNTADDAWEASGGAVSRGDPTLTYTSGLLTGVSYSGGSALTLAYISGVLDTVTDTAGPNTQLNYTSGVLTSVTYS